MKKTTAKGTVTGYSTTGNGVLADGEIEFTNTGDHPCVTLVNRVKGRRSVFQFKSDSAAIVWATKIINVIEARRVRTERAIAQLDKEAKEQGCEIWEVK